MCRALGGLEGASGYPRYLPRSTLCPACLVSWRQASAASGCYYCHGRTATLLLFRLCRTEVQPGQTLPDSMQPGQLNLCSTLSWSQLAGWAAKSIQSSMIHQIGAGICPERLDPAVAGLLTRGRHSRVEALRLETCCTNHRHRSGPSPSLVPVCQARLSWGITISEYPCPDHGLLPGRETARLLQVEPQLSVRGANPIMVTRSRRSHWHRDQGPEGFGRLSPAATSRTTGYLEVHSPAVPSRPSHSHIAH